MGRHGPFPSALEDGTLGTRTFYWLWSSSSNRWAVRQGDWKIVRYGTEPTASTDWQLFNLATDPQETTNLASTNTAKRDEMHGVFLAQRASDVTGNMVLPRLTASSPVTGAFTLNVSFTASVIGLELDDFEVVNGVASNLTGSGSVYATTITPTIASPGTVTVRLPANAATGTAAPSVPSNTLEVALASGINPVTPFNRGIAGQEDASGSGYILYSSESVHTRFAATAPHMYNADHFIAVRHNGSTWQYDTNTAYAAFTPLPTDVLVASVDFTADTLNMLAGTDTTTIGIATGYRSGDLIVLPNRWNGGGNTNEWDLAGNYIILNDGTELGIIPPARSATLFAPWATDADPIIVAVDFSEPVTGLGITDFTITNSLNATLSGSGSSYLLEITPSAPGIVSVDLDPVPVNEGPVTSDGSITHWRDYHLWPTHSRPTPTIRPGALPPATPMATRSPISRNTSSAETPSSQTRSPALPSSSPDPPAISPTSELPSATPPPPAVPPPRSNTATISFAGSSSPRTSPASPIPRPPSPPPAPPPSPRSRSIPSGATFPSTPSRSPPTHRAPRSNTSSSASRLSEFRRNPDCGGLPPPLDRSTWLPSRSLGEDWSAIRGASRR